MNNPGLEGSQGGSLARIWDEIVAAFPEPHLLQSWEWGQAKVRNGWQPFHLVWEDGRDGYTVLGSSAPARAQRASLQMQASAMQASAMQASAMQASAMQASAMQASAMQAAALVLKRAIPVRGLAARMSVLYVPKGPLVRDWGEAGLRRRVLEGLEKFARQQGAIFIKIDPDVRLGTGIPGEPAACEEPLGATLTAELAARGWRLSDEQVQFRNTVVLDLSGSEEELLGRMKQKTRYNVRLAQRKGVAVRSGSESDLELLYQMYAETAERDGFVIRDYGYYRDLWVRFLRPAEAASGRAGGETPNTSPVAEVLIAEADGDAAAAILVFRFGRRAWYLFGMSRAQHREKMPNQLLQWEAMRRAKAAGCTSYDLWGAPDDFVEGDPLWGVWRFKEGLGGEVVRHIGAWDLPVRPTLYWLYTQALPRLLEFMRRRARARTRQLTIKGDT